MEALELIVKVLLALVVVGFVGYPLLREEYAEEDFLIPQDLQDLLGRKESTYSALKELEFDFKTGKLSEVDFHDLEAKYRADAVELLEAIDLLEKGEEPRPRKGRKSGRLETKTATVAEVVQGGEDHDEAAEVQLSAGSAKRRPGQRAGKSQVGRGRTCPACDAENPAHAIFCASCGEPLPEEEAAGKRARKVSGTAQVVCDECGATLSAEHRFCGGCGAEVNA